MSDPRIGTVVGERFEILSKVGEGGMGIVYLADDRMSDDQAAVKFLHTQFMAKEEFVQRFRQEGKSASRFRHPNAVQILMGGEDDAGIPWLAMEFCGGRSLQGILRDDSPLPVDRACRIGRQILEAVGEAHKSGIIHRDLKPENIKVEVGPQGREKVKVLDFGVAKFIGTEDEDEMDGAVKTKTGVVFGTPKYMAPEQILGEPVDGRSDLYSIGAILYEMLSGGPPFPSDDILGFVTKHLKEPVEPLSTRVPDQKIPAGVEELVESLLAKDRAERPSRASDAVRRLDEVANREEPADVEPSSAGAKGALFLAGGVLGAAAAWAFGATGAAVAAGLGVGATIAYFAFPRIGETAFCLRTAIVAVLVAVAGAVAVFGLDGEAYLAVGLGTGAVLVYVLFSAGWGRRSRSQAFLLGGVVAPLVAIPLIPFPAGESFSRIWDLTTFDTTALGPALGLFLAALLFSATAFVVPLPEERK
ncbi:MAG: serine/threonine-protein kinase [Planctomycetota bacterium]